jgi:tetratricopeptide (TPR) repeat protein
MGFSGKTGGIGLTDVFQNVASNRSSGTLAVSSRRTERFVRFEDGAITGVSLGVGRGLPLPQHLRARGWVDQEAFDRLLAKRRRARKTPVRLAIEQGLLDEDSARAALSQCAEEQLYELAMLREAEFSFDEGPPPARVFDSDQHELGLRLEVGPVLMEAARRGDELDRIRRVVASPHDVFVLLEGWDEQPLAELAYSVAAELDGRANLATVCTRVQASPFEVEKIVADLVHEGVARRSTIDEIREVVEEVLREGRDDEALQLLRSAIEREPSDRDLRGLHAEALLRTGRGKDAAAEIALAGHQAARAGDIEEARAAYARAIELAPGELPFHEKNVELALEFATDDELVESTLALVAVYLDTGLADRARTVLRRVVEARQLGHHSELASELARVESCLGNWCEAATVYAGLAETLLYEDEERAIALLRLAVEQDPEDRGLQARLDDVETGRARRRRVRRRRLALASAATIALTCTGLWVTGEIVASHRVMDALSSALGDLRDGSGVDSLAELEAVRSRFGWTIAGRGAGRLSDQVANLQLDAIDGLIDDSRYTDARRLCETLSTRVDRGDLRATCESLTRRIADESAAFEVLRRVDHSGASPSTADLDRLRALAHGRYLPFLLAHLPEVRDHEVRQSMLDALARIDSPRAYPTVARLAMRVRDEGSWRRIRGVLSGAAAHREAGREAEWEGVYGELEERAEDPELGGRVATVLDLLRGH